MAVALDTRAWSEYPHSSQLWQHKTIILSTSQVNRFTLIDSLPGSLDVNSSLIPEKRRADLWSNFCLKTEVCWRLV